MSVELDDPFADGDAPEREVSRPGPWFEATFGSSTSCCGWAEEGETIRADGYGGWEHRDCSDEGRPPKICPRCRCALSASGNCACFGEDFS